MTKYNSLNDTSRKDLDHTPHVQKANHIENNLAYGIDKELGVAIVLGFTDKASPSQLQNLHIPDLVAGKYPVVGIANNAFYGEPIGNVYLGRNVEKIGQHAFAHNRMCGPFQFHGFSNLKAVSENAFTSLGDVDITHASDNRKLGTAEHNEFMDAVFDKTKAEMDSIPFSCEVNKLSKTVATEIYNTILNNGISTATPVTREHIQKMYDTFKSNYGWRIANDIDRLKAFRADVFQNLDKYCTTAGLSNNHAQINTIARVMNEYDYQNVTSYDTSYKRCKGIIRELINDVGMRISDIKDLWCHALNKLGIKQDNLDASEIQAFKDVEKNMSISTTRSNIGY